MDWINHGKFVQNTMKFYLFLGIDARKNKFFWLDCKPKGDYRIKLFKNIDLFQRLRLFQAKKINLYIIAKIFLDNLAQNGFISALKENKLSMSFSVIRNFKKVHIFVIF
jgi:hypothetical protein